MKKLFQALITIIVYTSVLHLCMPVYASRVQEMDTAVIALISTSNGGTDYTQDANAMGVWYMNGADGGDGSQTETDRTGNGNTLSPSVGDTITDSADVPSGYSGNSRDFELSDSEYLNIADGTELDISGADQSISFGCWVKFESEPGNGIFMYLISKYDASGNQRQYALTALGDGSGFAFRFLKSNDSTSGGSSNGVSTTINSYTTGIWYHVVAVYNDTDMRLYVNGSLDCTPLAETGGIYNSSSEFRLGATGTGGSSGSYFDGLIDEPFVFDDELTSAQVAEIYSSGISGNKGGND